MKSSTKLSLLALALLVPAVSLPLFVSAATTVSSVAKTTQQKVVKKAVKMDNKNVSRPAISESAMTAKITAIDKAIAANDYSAWVTAVGANSQIAKEVTSAEFPTYVEAHNLMKQAQEKLTSIGVTHEGRGEGWGLGKAEGTK